MDYLDNLEGSGVDSDQASLALPLVEDHAPTIPVPVCCTDPTISKEAGEAMLEARGYGRYAMEDTDYVRVSPLSDDPENGAV